MSTEEEYKELSAKLRYGLELAEQRLIEETARREGTLCYGRPDGKVVRISATELLKLRQSGAPLWKRKRTLQRSVSRSWKLVSDGNVNVILLSRGIPVN